MNKNLENYIKQQEKLKKLINATSSYNLFHKYSELMNYYNPSETLKHQLESINKTEILLHNQYNSIYGSIKPTLQYINEQMKLIEQININNSSIYKNIQKIQNNINLLLNSTSINLNEFIPESLYYHLEQISSELEKSPKIHEGYSVLPAEITVVTPENQQFIKIDWYQFIQFMLTIITIIITIYTNHENTKQFEKQMNEMQNQTHLLEKQIEVQEQILYQIQSIKEQQEEVNDSINEKLNNIVEAMEPLINNSIEDNSSQ